MSAHKTAINLLPKTEFELSFWGRFLKWSLTAGRYIIILTEMVVILAFLSRFKLDKDLADLNDSISGKKNILVATYAIEQNFRSAQTRINQAKELLAITPSASTLLGKVTSTVPQGVILAALNISLVDKAITVAAVTQSEGPLNQYLAALSADKTWSKVDLTDVQSMENIITFSLKISY